MIFKLKKNFRKIKLIKKPFVTKVCNRYFVGSHMPFLEWQGKPLRTVALNRATGGIYLPLATT